MCKYYTEWVMGVTVTAGLKRRQGIILDIVPSHWYRYSLQRHYRHIKAEHDTRLRVTKVLASAQRIPFKFKNWKLLQIWPASLYLITALHFENLYLYSPIPNNLIVFSLLLILLLSFKTGKVIRSPSQTKVMDTISLAVLWNKELALLQKKTPHLLHLLSYTTSKIP